MCLPIKLISTDFDGTLFAELATPPIPETLHVLIGDLQSRGAKWVINTGRDMLSLMEALDDACLPVKPDYLVLVEREIYCHNNSCYHSVDEWNTACSRAHADIFARVRSDIPRLCEWISTRFRAQLYEDEWSPFCLIAENVSDAEVIHDYLEEYCRGVPDLTLVRNNVYARFAHSSFNKGTALGEISRRLGLSPEVVFAAGDHLNDLPMLSRRYARWLTAPGNAVDPVKEAVRAQGGHVSDLSYGHGVAEGLRASLARVPHTQIASGRHCASGS